MSVIIPVLYINVKEIFYIINEYINNKFMIFWTPRLSKNWFNSTNINIYIFIFVLLNQFLDNLGVQKIINLLFIYSFII